MAAAEPAMSFQTELASQSWALYGIGMFMIVIRTYVTFTSAEMHLRGPDSLLLVMHDGVVYEVFHSLQSMTGS